MNKLRVPEGFGAAAVISGRKPNDWTSGGRLRIEEDEGIVASVEGSVCEDPHCWQDSDDGL